MYRRPPPIFLSHAWADRSDERTHPNPRRGLVDRLASRLTSVGLEVFIDQTGIQQFDSIEKRLREQLASAGLFIAWYSNVYPTRRACHWELTAAFTTDATRVAVLNPESDVSHILPASLRSSRIAEVPAANDEAGWDALITRIVELSGAQGGTFGDIARDADARWYGSPPTRFSRFVGRGSLLWRLDSLLRPESAAAGGNDAPDAVVVFGIGGVGKTALVLEYAARFAAAFRGGIYWLRVASPDSGTDAECRVLEGITAAHLSIVEQLELLQRSSDDDQPTLSPEELRRSLGTHLRDLCQPFLWIVDDFPAGLNAVDFAACLPPGGRGVTIVTTQGTSYRHVPNLEVTVLQEAEALDLLLSEGHASDDVTEREAAKSLSARLGYLPLALEVVSSLAALPGSSPTSLLAELEVGTDTALGLTEEAAENPATAPSRTGHTPSVLKTFALSISRLDSASFSLLAVCGTVNVAPLPVRLLWSIVNELVPNLGGSQRAAVAVLLSRSLARAIDSETIEVHGLIGEAVRRYLADQPAAVAASIALAQRKVRDGLGDFEDISSHQASRSVATFGHALATHLIADGRQPLDRAMLRCLGRFLNVEHRFSEAAAFERLVVALSEADKTLSEREKLVAKSNLAISLNQLGSSAEAILLLREAHEGLRILFGYDDIDAITVQHNLSNALFSVDASESRRLALDAYQRRVRVLGADHQHTLFSLHSLLSASVIPAPYADIEDAYRDLIARRTKVLGATHGSTLTSISNYVVHLASVGRADEAVPFARTLVEKRAALYGPTHSMTILARSRLLQALCAAQKFEADEVELLAKDIESAAIELGSIASLQSLSNAAEALRSHGHAARAVELLGSARRIARARLGADDLLVFLIEHNLAAAIASAGDAAGARSMYDELVPRINTALGAEHRLALRARRQLSLLAVQMGEVETGRALQAESLEILRRLFGEASPEFAEGLGDMAATFEKLGRPVEASVYRARQAATGYGGRIDAARRV